MELCIDKSFLGTPSSLVVASDGTFYWSHNPKADITLGGREGILYSDVVSLVGGEPITLPPVVDAHIMSFRQLGIDLDEIPWYNVLGPKLFKRHLKAMVSKARRTLRDLSESGYFSTYKECYSFLGSLHPPKVNLERLNESIAANSSGASVESTLKSFLPTSEGHTREIVYSTVDTATGRLIVKEGPSILTLPSKHRNILESSHSGGNIYQVDFVSLEPKVMLYTTGRHVPKDVYLDLMSKIPDLGSQRKAAKVASLSALYGSSPRGLSSILGNYNAAKRAIAEVVEYFGSSELASDLKSELGGHGFIRNYYGRPLLIKDDKSNILVNHYVQSTAADTALLGFGKLMKKMGSLKVTPHYVIHDALILDIPPEHKDKFLAICDQGVGLGIGHFNFKTTVIS